MNEREAVDFFEARVAADVRRMPLAEAQPYLQGLLHIAHPEELSALRKIHASLCDCDAQLELIAAAQRRLF